MTAMAWLTTLLLLFAAGPARGDERICVQDLARLIAWQEKLPLGCELVDCCPDCPRDAPLDLAVRVSGELLAGVEIRLPSGERASAARGETRLPGIGRVGGEGPVPLATLSVEIDEERGRRAAAAGAPLGSASVEVEQWIGSKLVNAFAARWYVASCPKLPLTPCDTIVTPVNAGGDNSVLLLDGLGSADPAACLDDEILRTPHTAAVGNLRPPGSCHSEVAVFSQADRMALRESPTNWTGSCGDVLTLDLAPILEAPVNVFLVVPSLLAKLVWGQAALDVAKEDMDNANQTYDENKTGIAFEMKPHALGPSEQAELVSLLPAALKEALLSQSDLLSLVCALPAEFETKGWYVEGELNVYYLPLPFTGMLCDSDRNVIFVGLIEKPATLAHEFGHSLSLVGPWGHSNSAPGFDEHNVMWVSAPDVRDHLSLGQALRLNVEQTSTLNTNGVRSGPVRPCLPDASPTAACPRLDLDWVRP